MKLFEVMYTKCKVCGGKIGKGGRDHRFGVCDKHVYEGMQASPLRNAVEELLWKEYQQDAFMPAQGEYPAEMDDEDYLDFEDHVDHIVAYAQKSRIRSARKAIDAYNDMISMPHLKTVVH